MYHLTQDGPSINQVFGLVFPSSKGLTEGISHESPSSYFAQNHYFSLDLINKFIERETRLRDFEGRNIIDSSRDIKVLFRPFLMMIKVSLTFEYVRLRETKHFESGYAF